MFWGAFGKQRESKLMWRRVADCSRHDFLRPEKHGRRHMILILQLWHLYYIYAVAAIYLQKWGWAFSYWYSSHLHAVTLPHKSSYRSAVSSPSGSMTLETVPCRSTMYAELVAGCSKWKVPNIAVIYGGTRGIGTTTFWTELYRTPHSSERKGKKFAVNRGDLWRLPRTPLGQLTTLFQTPDSDEEGILLTHSHPVSSRDLRAPRSPSDLVPPLFIPKLRTCPDTTILRGSNEEMFSPVALSDRCVMLSGGSDDHCAC